MGNEYHVLSWLLRRPPGYPGGGRGEELQDAFDLPHPRRRARVHDVYLWLTWGRHNVGGFLVEGGVPYLPLTEPQPRPLSLLVKALLDLGPFDQHELDDLARAWLAVAADAA